MFKKNLETIAAFGLMLFYRFYSRFWRVEKVRYPGESKGGPPRLWAHWHGDELLLVALHAQTGMGVMASRSRDGELMGKILRWMGYRVVRGSSTRGGAGGLKGLIDAVQKEGIDASLAVDGPRGPLYKVKPGILALAQQTGSVVIPGAAASSRRFVFKRAWNQCYLPFPFSRCVITYGEPMKVPKEITVGEFENLRLTLERRLLALKVEAEGRFARTVEAPALVISKRELTGV